MPHPALHVATQWITEAAVQHGDALPETLMQRLQIPRRRALELLRKLVALQWLHGEGPPRRRIYKPGPLRQVVKHYPLAGLQEDLPWRLDFSPYLALPEPVQRMAQHAFTELLNNAIDHSGGGMVTVSMRQTPQQLQLLVSDDGCGLFDRIARDFAIADAPAALLELSKGKLTSAPQQHSGQGLFFTARLADVFDIHANAQGFQRRAWDPMQWRPTRHAARGGTSIYLAMLLDTSRTLEQVLRTHSLQPQSYAFDSTVVPLHLISCQQMLASRAEARRVSARLPAFKRAELDFAGVEQVGHAFADELFRVFGQAHPGLELVPTGMNMQVAQMVRSVAACAHPGAGQT